MKTVLQTFRSVIVVLLSTLTCIATLNAAEPATSQTLSELMAGPITNTSNELWNAALIEPAAGAATPVPTAEQWASFKKNAQELQALGSRLLDADLKIAPIGKVANEGELTPDGVAALRKEQWDLWKAQVSILADGANNSMKAINDKNFNEMVEAGDVLYNVCDSCHKLFWYPPAK